MLCLWWMNHVWHCYIPHPGGISRFIKSLQINACHCKMCANSQRLTKWWQVRDKSAGAECANVKAAEMSHVRLDKEVAVLLLFFGLLCHTPVLTMMNKEVKYLRQATQIHTFVITASHLQRAAQDVFACTRANMLPNSLLCNCCVYSCK